MTNQSTAQPPGEFLTTEQLAKLLQVPAQTPAPALEAAEALRAAAVRLGSSKPRRSRGLPSRGRLTNAGRDISLEQMRAAAEAAEAIVSGRVR
jgi:hypothetical protein